jgi:hypothetical protein
MLIVILAFLIIFWILGYLPVPNLLLFSINGHPVTLWNLLILLFIIWAVGILPSPLQSIAGVLLFLWILSLLGIIAIAGFSNLIVWAIIIGLFLYILQGGR